MPWLRLTLQLIPRLLLRPLDLVALLRLMWRFRRREWMRHPPFLPVPSTIYLRWRMLTAYGDENALPQADELLRFARWATRPA
ncbi:MAG TPA: hypothetical protein VGD77_06105 [Gemmatimonadaceae bacterium]|jgi:hypothetical protein